MMDGYYIVWDTQSGIYDGAYANLEDALESHKNRTKVSPKGSWVVVQLIYSPSGHKLADEKFHANIEE
jgi:hypothetical protein